MVTDMDQQKIVIKLPENDYYNYKSINDRAGKWPVVLNSMVVVPALLYVLEELKRLTPDERYESYSTYRWYGVIKKELSTGRWGWGYCDIGSDMSSLEILKVAQHLINTPLSGGLRFLSSVHGNDEEEDEE